MLRLRPRLAMLVACLALAAFVAPPFVEQDALAQTKKPTKKKKKKPAPKKKPPTPVDGGDIDDDPAPATPGNGAATGAGATAAPKGTHPINAELMLGYAFSGAGCGTGSCNFYGFGFGARGGYKLPIGLWIGGSLGYHFGQTSTVRVGTNPFTTNYSGSVFWIGPEGGYDFKVGPVVLRPYLGLGIGALSQSVKDQLGPDQGVDKGSGGARFMVWPGAQGIYSFSPTFYAALDARLLVMVDGPSAFGLYAAGGMRFGP